MTSSLFSLARPTLLTVACLPLLAGSLWGAVTYHVTNYGADSSGATLSTSAFQGCIDAVNAAGGGIANVPAGTYLIGTLVLKSNVTLNLSANALVKISTNPAHLAPNPYDSILINAIRADGANNIGISGPGTIDVQGAAWKGGGGSTNWIAGRPNRVIMPVNSTGVTLRDFSIINSCGWTINPVACDNVLIDGVTVKSVPDMKWNDGIDLESCRNVLVANVWVETGDDALTIKSGGAHDPNLVRTSYDIHIRDSYLFSHNASALKMGNENIAAIYDVVAENLEIGTQHAGLVGVIGIACHANAGAHIYNVTYRDIVMNGVKRPISVIETKYNAGPLSPTTYGNLHDITFENISVTDAHLPACILAGPNDTIENVTLKNVEIHTREARSTSVAAPAEPFLNGESYGTMPAFGLYARRVTGLHLLRNSAGRGVAFFADAPDVRNAVERVSCTGDTSGLIDDTSGQVLRETFDSDDVGLIPVGWTATGGGTVYVDDVPSTSDRSLHVTDSGTSVQRTAERSFVYRTAGTVVSYAVRLPQTSAVHALSLRDTAGTAAVTIAFDASGQLFAYDGSVKRTLQSYAANTWYQITVRANPDGDGFSVDVNDVPRGSNWSFRTPVSHLNEIHLASGTATVGSAWYDDLVVEPDYVSTHGFDSTAVGAVPAGWSISGPGSATVQATPSSTDRSLRLVDTSTSGGISAGHAFGSRTDPTTVEYRVLASQTSALHAFYLQDAAGANAAIVAFDHTGQIYTYDGSTKVNLQSYQSGRWYQVKVVARPANGTLDLFIDGILRAEAMGFRSAVSSVARLEVRGSNAHLGTFFYDNVSVYE